MTQQELEEIGDLIADTRLGLIQAVMALAMQPSIDVRKLIIDLNHLKNAPVDDSPSDGAVNPDLTELLHRLGERAIPQENPTPQ